MKKILIVLGLFLFPHLAEAQTNTRNPCYYLTPTSTSCINVTPTTPLPVTGGGGGGGGAATIANGADVAEGSTTDAPATSPTSTSAATTISLLKALVNGVSSSIPAGTNVIGALSPNQSINNAQWGGVTLGAPSNYGTSPGAVAVNGVNAFITNSPTVTNAGTFAVQNTAATPAGTNSIGTVVPSRGAPVTCSLTVTTGGTAQNAFTGLSGVNNVIIQDIDTGKTEGLWISFVGTAAPNTVDSFYIPPYSAANGAGSYSSPQGQSPTQLSIYAATTGHKVSCNRS